MLIVPPLIAVLLSACIPSSPVFMLNVPSDMLTFAFECTASSAEFMSSCPPDTVTFPEAFMPFALVLSESELLSCAEFCIPKPLPNICSDFFSALELPPPDVMSKLPPLISIVREASIPSPSAFILNVPFSMYTKPFVVSSEFSECMPSLPALRVNVPFAVRTLSLPEIAWF